MDKRPDMFEKLTLTSREDKKLVEEIEYERLPDRLKLVFEPRRAVPEDMDALLELCRMEGIPPENVAAAGNYLNDRDMIEHAGIGIAVGNAVPEIKELADIVLQHDCEHDAIAELVDKLLAM